MLFGLTLRLRLRVLFAILLAAGVCCAVTPAVKAFALKIGAVDAPGESRRIHDRPIPRMGGLAILIGFLMGVLPFTALTQPIKGILVGSAMITALGMLDDILDLKPWIKLLVQLAAAFVAVQSGVVIHFVTNPGGTSSILLGALSVPITLLWIVGITNALNLIDGMDGLAAGVSSISCAAMLAVSMFMPEATDVSVLLGGLGGACLGFLPYNRNPAKIFMGDTGAMLLGYVLATASVLGLLKMYTLVTFAVPLLALALPLSDTLFAIIRRTAHGKSIFRADRGHIHHRLLALGLTQKQSVAILYAVSAILGLAAVLIAAGAAARFWLLLAAFFIAAAVWLYVFLGLHAAEEREKQEHENKKENNEE